MRIKETKVYKFAELSERAKEKARDWYKSGPDDGFWSEHILTDMGPAVLKYLGYTNPEIQYSGFWSQGDGACFSGSWYSSLCAPDALKADFTADKELHRIADALAVLIAKHPGMSASLTHAHRGQHEMCISFAVNFDDEPDEVRDELRGATLDEDEEEFKELSRDLMRWIYKSLEAEYNYQNADEQVDEMMDSNAYEFTEDGSPA